MAKKKTNPSDVEGGEAGTSSSESAGGQTKSSGDEPISPYFRKLLEKRPDLVKNRSNEEIYDIWLTDHPGHKEVPTKVRNILSNIKSQLRNKKKRGRKRKAKAKAAATNGAVARGVVKSTSTRSLEKLEEMIDDCLSLARNEAPQELETVIQHLRKARNQVVRKMGP